MPVKVLLQDLHLDKVINKAGDVEQNDLSKIDIRNMNMQQLRDLASQMAYKAPPMPRDRSLDDFKIDFGLDLIVDLQETYFKQLRYQLKNL